MDPLRHEVSDDDDDGLPDLKTIIILPPSTLEATRPTLNLRRSPRKNATTTTTTMTPTAVTSGKIRDDVETGASISVRSSQRQQQRTSPAKKSSVRSPLKVLAQSKAVPSLSLLLDVPVLSRNLAKVADDSWRDRDMNSSRVVGGLAGGKFVETALPLSSAATQARAREEGVRVGVGDQHTSRSRRSEQRQRSHRSTVPTADVYRPCVGSNSRKSKTALRASRFVLNEATCDEDLADSDANNEHEDEEDTDLSGFIVDDHVDVSVYGDSSDATDSEEERRLRRKVKESRKKTQPKPNRRLQRGRKVVTDSENEDNSNEDLLSKALGELNLDTQDKGSRGGNKNVEVVDLTSSPEHKHADDKESQQQLPGNTGSAVNNLFEKLKALKLSPPRSNQPLSIPSKLHAKMAEPPNEEKDELANAHKGRFTTPPVTPPRSPTKLKSPSKLMSPTKRGDGAQKSPHRQSMDAFWDLDEVNKWNDQFSPKKAPLTSPRKNRLAALELWSDLEEEGEEDENDSFEGINEISDSLPSPCASPSKSKSRAASPVKLEKQRLLAEKKARENEKKQFEATKDQMATELFSALDKNVIGGRIGELAASTGGVRIIWSNTLRSTAGRANWRRVVTKATTGSPVKSSNANNKNDLNGASDGTTIVHHYANIELATKVIDRPDRLTNTLAHEFCHLANFMISNVHDQPHGQSFQRWGQKVTSWMESQTSNPAWNAVQVTTKHGYVIEWKYLWLCAGRKSLDGSSGPNGDDDGGCGAEYGRHSKSIDVDSHRCGRCKGVLVQVRPKPRKSSPVKKKPAGSCSPVKNGGLRSGAGAGTAKKDSKVDILSQSVEIIELSE